MGYCFEVVLFVRVFMLFVRFLGSVRSLPINTSLRLYFTSAALSLLSVLCLHTFASAQDQSIPPADDGEEYDPASREEIEAFLRWADTWLDQLESQKRWRSADLQSQLATRDCGMVKILLGTHASDPTPNPYYMARLIEDGRCLDRPLSEAISYYRDATKHPDLRGRAHARLAQAYHQGLSASHDPKMAEHHLRAAVFFSGRWIPRDIIQNREPKLSEAFGDILDPSWRPSGLLSKTIATFKRMAANRPSELLELVLQFCSAEDLGCSGAKLSWLEAMADLLHYAPAKYQYAKHLIELETLRCDGDQSCIKRVFRPMQSAGFTIVKNLATAGMLDYIPAINELLSHLESTKPNPSYLKAVAFWCIRFDNIKNINTHCSKYNWNNHFIANDIETIRYFANSFSYPNLPPLKWHIKK